MRSGNTYSARLVLPVGESSSRTPPKDLILPAAESEARGQGRPPYLAQCRFVRALFCLGLGLLACPSGDRLPVRELSSVECGGLAPVLAPFARVLEDTQSYEQLFSELTDAFPPPEVDFTAERVLVAYGGRRDECGATVSLEDVVYTDETTLVRIVRRELGLGCFGDGALNGPALVVAFPKRPGSVEIEETTTVGESCRSGQ